MKRASGSVTKDNDVLVKKEVGEEDGRERKRAKISREKSNVPTDIKGSANNNEANGDVLPNHLNVQFLDAQTSTPISDNSPPPFSKKTVHYISESMSLSHGSSLSDIVMSTSVSNINATIDTNGSELPASGDFSNKEGGDKEETLHSSEEKNEIGSSEQVSNQNSMSEHHDVVIDVESSSAQNTSMNAKNEAKASVWKYDIECFTSSLLLVTPLEGHSDTVLSVAAAGDVILSASADTTIKMWNATSKTEICNFQGHTDSVTAVVLLTSGQTTALANKMNFSNISQIAISSSVDCSVRLWAVPSGAELSSFYTYNGISCLEYLENDFQVVIGTEGGKLELWDLCSSKLVHSVLAHDNGITCLKVDDSYVYTTSKDGMIKVWLIEDNELNGIYTRKRKQPSKVGSSLEPSMWKCLSHHNSMIYLGDDTSNLKILNWKEGRLNVVKSPTPQTGIVDAIFVKDDVLLSSYYDPVNLGRINVWQLPSMTYICTLSGDIGKLYSLSFTTTENKILRIVSGGERLLVWDFICSKPASKEINAKYQCQEIEQADDDEEEEQEKEENVKKSPYFETAKKSPYSETAKSYELSMEKKSNKRSSWPCVVM